MLLITLQNILQELFYTRILRFIETNSIKSLCISNMSMILITITISTLNIILVELSESKLNIIVMTISQVIGEETALTVIYDEEIRSEEIQQASTGKKNAQSL